MSYADKKDEKKTLAGSSYDDYTESERACINSAMNILAFANNTERKLREKLGRKGYSPEDVDIALEYVKSKGYINDSIQVQSTAQMLANNKLYGKKRITLELVKKGFCRDDIAALDYDELEIDFVSNCADLICRVCKLYDDEEKRSFELTDKVIAYLIRYGYTVSEIREATRLLRED